MIANDVKVVIGYQPAWEFTAQSKTVAALMAMYANFEQNEDAQIELTPIVVFLAFSIESYLNSIGARKLEIWDEVERLPWRSKVTILHKTANASLDWGKDPLQFAREVFTLRDKLAHGKPERVVGQTFGSYDEASAYLHKEDMEPEWYTGITREWIARAKERFHILMRYLGGLFDLSGADHLHAASGEVQAVWGDGLLKSP